MYNKNENTKMTPAAKASRVRRTKTGSYAVILTVLVLAIIIVANVIMYSLPQEYTLFDTTKTEWTEISAQTENFVSLIDVPVTVYVLCENGDIDYQYNSLLEKYAEANENIKLEIVDPLENPNFITKYTDVTLTNGSLIVESAKRFTVVDYSTMTYYASPTYNSMMQSETDVKLSYSEYQQVYQNFASSYGYYLTDFEQYFQAETLITSALDYVTIPTVPQTYMLQSTGMDDKKLYGEFSETLSDYLINFSLEPKTLDLKKEGAVIPEDASTIIIYAPREDITESELSKLEAFTSAGGSIMLVTDPTSAGFKNLMKLGAIYGCAPEEGMVRDGDEAHYNGTTTVLKPEISTEHQITYSLLVSGMTVQMPNAHSIAISDKLPENVEAMELFYTSKKGFRVSTEDDNTRLDETNGVFNVGVAASKKISSNTTSYFVWLGSTGMLTDEQATAVYNGNYAYFIYGMRWASDIFSSEYSVIPATNISGDYLDGLDLPAVLVIGAITVIVIPVAVLVSGFVIWFKRRRR